MAGSLSHFCIQIDSDTLVSHMLLWWMWWEVSSQWVKSQHSCSKLERRPTCFLCPPSHSACVSLLYRRCLLHSLYHCEKGSVSHFLCVCLSRNVCGTIADSSQRIQEFIRHSPGSNSNDATINVIVILKEPLIYHTESIPEEAIN